MKAKKSKLDAILDSLEDWCRNDPDEQKLPGPLSAVLKAKTELKKLRKSAEA
jgi:hypothetical protein